MDTDSFKTFLYPFRTAPQSDRFDFRCPARVEISPTLMFHNFHWIKYDSHNNLFLVLSKDCSKFTSFLPGQVSLIIRHSNSLVKGTVDRKYGKEPAGYDVFVDAWNTDPLSRPKLAYRESLDGTPTRWVIPETPLSEDLIAFPNYNDNGHYIDPRLKALGGYVGHNISISNSFVYHIQQMSSLMIKRLTARGRPARVKADKHNRSPQG